MNLDRLHILCYTLQKIGGKADDYSAGHPSDLSELSQYAVDTRYPGDSATPKNAEQAADLCTGVRQVIRSELKLPQNQPERQN